MLNVTLRRTIKMQDHMTAAKMKRERDDIKSPHWKRQNTRRNRHENEYKYRIEFFSVRVLFFFCCSPLLLSFACLLLVQHFYVQDASERTDCWKLILAYGKQRQCEQEKRCTGCDVHGKNSSYCCGLGKRNDTIHGMSGGKNLLKLGAVLSMSRTNETAWSLAAGYRIISSTVGWCGFIFASFALRDHFFLGKDDIENVQYRHNKQLFLSLHFFCSLVGLLLRCDCRCCCLFHAPSYWARLFGRLRKWECECESLSRSLQRPLYKCEFVCTADWK